MKLFSVVCVVALLTSCATYISTDYIGWSEKRIINELGVPDKTYKLEGTSYLEYVRSENYKTSAHQSCNSQGTDKHRHSNCITYGGEEVTSTCTLTLTIEQNKVSNYKRRGDQSVCQQLENWKEQVD